MTALIRTNLPVLVVIAPLFVAFILPPLARRIRLVEALAFLATVFGFGAAGYLAAVVFAQKGSPFIYQLGLAGAVGSNWWRKFGRLFLAGGYRC